ncbi:MAG: hypothetical protein C0518_02140 [Opitutus sp.]|nr:hypothetical protein [Opitutus sp.]
MKTRLVLLFALLFGGGSLLAQTTKQPAAPGKAAPGKSAPGKTEPAKEEFKIEGTTLNRADGTFLGLTLQDGKFKLSFHDQEKKPMPVNVLRAVARWPNVHGPGQNRTVLTPAGDGTFLLGAQFVRPPLSFKLFLTLVAAEDGESTENYTVDFRG